MEEMSKCGNCGAPLRSDTCDYCKYPIKPKVKLPIVQIADVLEESYNIHNDTHPFVIPSDNSFEEVYFARIHNTIMEIRKGFIPDRHFGFYIGLGLFIGVIAVIGYYALESIHI